MLRPPVFDWNLEFLQRKGTVDLVHNFSGVLTKDFFRIVCAIISSL